MPTAASFQTRARAIDHLGRGQIADCPTAVTELWKNAYDAYARHVSLHVFEGTPPIASIFDDGCGMNFEELEQKWLVIGTESKASAGEVPEKDRLGLSLRPRMGEKGIGRLSAGFLAPVTFLISKRVDSQFASVLVDWRLFENPYLYVSDIKLPIREFHSLNDLTKIIESMSEVIVGNLTGSLIKNEKESDRVRKAWDDFSSYEKSTSEGTTTAEKIQNLANAWSLKPGYLEEWSVQRGESNHGTAIFCIDTKRELSVWTDPSASDDPEADAAKQNVVLSLTRFTDPDNPVMSDFTYDFEVHRRSNTDEPESSFSPPRLVVHPGKQVHWEWLHGLEHVIAGKFDEKGTFRGTVKAFGRELGNCTIPATVPGLRDSRGRSRIGQFGLQVATHEGDAKNSTHSKEELSALEEFAKNNSGLMVYRDGVRVLPYGRPNSDFFELEERRGRHAGREFWVHRKTFGRVLITRDENPLLKDKAGREGLVDNEARRLMWLLVVGVLKESARKYFGSDSDIRKETIPEIQARNRRAKESQERLRQTRRSDFLAILRTTKRKLSSIESTAERFQGRFEMAKKAKDVDSLNRLQTDISAASYELDELVPPSLPKSLRAKETEYRAIRDQLALLRKQLKDLHLAIVDFHGQLSLGPPGKSAQKAIEVSKENLERIIRKRHSDLQTETSAFLQAASVASGRFLSQFYERCEQISASIDQMDVHLALQELQQAIDDSSDEAVSYYDNARAVVKWLSEGVDIVGAIGLSEDEQFSATERSREVLLLAQSGIAVELIGHELEEMASEADGNLRRLSPECRSSRSYKRAYNAFVSLIDRFRFLSPLNVASYRAREPINGTDIATFIEGFFSKRFEAASVTFQASDAFRSFEIKDVPSRIYPVFVNLVSNSLYWLRFSSVRQIVFDRLGDLVVVADSGPGIDPEDVPDLFEMFFSKRPQGRGVGLYLCRANLAVAHHDIRYASGSDPHILPGANFVISFRGMTHD